MGRVYTTKPMVNLICFRCLDIFVVCVVWGGGCFGCFYFDCVEVRLDINILNFVQTLFLCYFIPII